jgi:histidinol-phosphate aminotransferase
VKTFADLANPWVNGLGVYEPGRPIEEVARELGFADPSSIIKLASNENALGPSPKAVRAMMACAADMHRYPDGGAFYLRGALGRKLGVEPGQVLIGNGSNEIIEFLGHVFLRQGTSIVMADGAFIVYKLVAASSLARVVAVPMKALTHDLDAMAAAIQEDTRLVFIANPNNPTATTVSREAIERFMARVPDHVVVCFDEAYVELMDPKDQPDTLRYVREGRNVVVMRTFSKTYGLAGLRVGYAVAPEACIGLFNRVRQPFNVSAMALAAALAALDDDEHVEKTRRMVREGLAYLTESFRGMGLAYVPACANFMLVEVGKGREVFQALEREGVIVRPVDVYGLPQYVRVTVGTGAENRRLVEAMARVMKKRVAG